MNLSTALLVRKNKAVLWESSSRKNSWRKYIPSMHFMPHFVTNEAICGSQHMKSLLCFIESDYSRHHIPSAFTCFGPHSKERDEERGVSQLPENFYTKTIRYTKSS